MELLSSRGRRIAALLAVAAAATFGATSSWFTAGAQAPAIEVTGAGVGGVTLHTKYKLLRRQGLLGKKHGGCELGLHTAAASLVPPLGGSVDLSQNRRKRRVADIAITGGATARGVGVGSTMSQVLAAFPGAQVNHGSDQVFRFTTVKILPADGGPFAFAVSLDTGLVIVIGIPFIPVCE